ncbi:nuclear factor interleukin-3-regulated protein-like [Stegostoma tigrinum]|uniref:nuclear factor interleukin-3-regulated protein-like n=1 Tax=Stegostoma tigrinum TaxID=3053191 RepID=UPI00202ADC12|nr:nuclear factor interleukin-3-regulated protein-like [Stegostoma tigrinum]
MESGYYSELESLASAPLCLSETLGPYSDGLAQRNRPGKGRSGSSGRRKREFISDEKKDATYWEKRRKNNEAAKRSREKRRISDLVLESQVLALNEENVRLRSELLALKLRFGLITTAGYAPKSPYYGAYSNGPGSLLHSDSSEAEHSSRGSGSAAGSKSSPRGSLSDISDVSSSARDSPEPAMHRDELQGPLKEPEGARARDDPIGHAGPATCKPGPPAGAEQPRVHTSRAGGTFPSPPPSPAEHQPNQVGPRAGYTQLAVQGGLGEAPPPRAPDGADPGARRVKGHPLPDTASGPLAGAGAGARGPEGHSPARRRLPTERREGSPLGPWPAAGRGARGLVRDAAPLCGSRPQELRRTALPHKLRLKVRSSPASEQRSAQGLPAHRDPALGGHGEDLLWATSFDKDNWVTDRENEASKVKEDRRMGGVKN